MLHIVFFALNIFLALLILATDRKNFRSYLVLGFVGLLLAYVFETVTTYLGFWYYHSEPRIPLVSLYTWLMYFPYLSFCYFIGKRFGDANV